MDIGIIRGLVTLVLLIAFIGLVASVWGRRQAATFDEAAQLPLEDDAAGDRAPGRAVGE